MTEFDRQLKLELRKFRDKILRLALNDYADQREHNRLINEEVADLKKLFGKK